MKKAKRIDKNQERLEEAVYKFKFTKEQNRDLQTAFEIFDKDGTGMIDIKDLKVILRALGFEPQEDEIKKLLSTINRSDDNDDNNAKKSYSSDTIDFEEFKKIMNNKLRKSEEIEQLKIGFHSFTDQKIKNDPSEQEFITLRSLREIAEELHEVINDEELKEMMVQANPELKSLINEGKGDDEAIYKISQTQFNQLLDRIKSGN
jgi:Ca2+-binding EF-hand superfamily protein